ncbi:MAG: hypothetical protein AB2L20_18130 [Mangrovibacterium sp.]
MLSSKKTFLFLSFVQILNYVCFLISSIVICGLRVVMLQILSTVLDYIVNAGYPSLRYDEEYYSLRSLFILPTDFVISPGSKTQDKSDCLKDTCIAIIHSVTYIYSAVIISGAIIFIITGEGLFEPTYIGRLSQSKIFAFAAEK